MPAYVAIIDVGHGNSTVINDGATTFIIDCGSRGTSLLEFLKNEGISTIDHIFLSHADQDHIGGLLKILSSAEFNINNVYVNTDSSKGSLLWNGLVYELSQLNEKGKLTFIVGISRSIGPFHCGNVQLNVVGPSPYLAAKGPGGLDSFGNIISSNSVSASFHVLWEGKVVAFLSGDIDQIALDDLILHNVNLETPLMVFPHHGGRSDEADLTAFTAQLCDLTKAVTVIFSIGRNKHLNPRPEVISTVRSKVNNVRIACTQLSKNCSTNISLVNALHLHPFFSHGRAKNEACCGTFVIELEENVTYLPDRQSHMAYIEAVAPDAMCNSRLN